MLAFLASTAVTPQRTTATLYERVEPTTEVKRDHYRLCPQRKRYPVPSKMQRWMTSSAGEEAYLEEHFFKQVDYGSYFDIGCGDGITNSSTHYFYHVKRWTGICIEPNFDKHSVIYKADPGRANRIDGIRVAIAPYNDNSVMYSPFYGLQVKENPAGLWYQYYHPYEVFAVQTINPERIQELFYDNSNYPYTKRTVHLVSIDTDGTEVDIVRSWPFKFNCVKAFSIANKFWCDKHSNVVALQEILHPQGYFHNASLGDKEIFIRSAACPLIIDDREFRLGPLPDSDDDD